MSDKEPIIRPAEEAPEQQTPLAGSTVHAGFPSPAEDFLDAPLDLNRALVHNPASTFFVRVAGDSMKPAMASTTATCSLWTNP